MPKVREYQPDQVQTQVAPGATLSQLPSSAFSGIGDVTEGLSNLAKGVSDMKDRIDLTQAEEALVKFERDKNKLFFDPESGYFNTEGKAAFDSSKDVNKSLTDLARKYSESLPAGAARQAFVKVANKHVTSAQRDIMLHASKGIQAWEKATSDAMVENSIENAALYWNDPQKIAVQRQLGRQEIMAQNKREGITGEAANERLQTFDSSFAASAIDAATVQSGIQGREALNKFGGMLEGPERVKLEKRVQIKENQDREQAVSQQSIMKATNIVSRVGDDRQAVLDEVNKIADPEVQQKARKEAMYQLNQREEAKSEARMKAFEDAETFVMDQGSAEQFKAAFPDKWESLSPKQKATLERGEPISNDWNLWYDLSLKSEKELKSITPDKLASYSAKLDKTHRDKFISMVRAAKGLKKSGASSKVDTQIGRTRASQTLSAVEQVMGSNRRKWNTRDKAQADRLYSMFDAELKSREDLKGGDLDSEEFTNLLNGFVRKAKIDRGFFASLRYGSDIDINEALDMIPEEYLGQLTQHLRKNGIPITTYSLVNAYEQAISEDK